MRRCRVVLVAHVFVCAFGGQAIAQRVAPGLIAGTTLTGDVQYYAPLAVGGYSGYAPATASAPKRYLVGATLDIQLSSGFALEIDGLYRPLGFSDSLTRSDGFVLAVERGTVVTWEFPVLGKVKLPFVSANGRMTPFISAGPSFRIAGNLNGYRPSFLGGTAGLGCEILLPRNVRLTPAIRYTRWQADKAGARTVPDQVEVTMEISKARLLAPRNAARRLYFGIVVGGTLTKDFGTETFGQTVSGSGPRSVVPGAMIECRLHRGLSVEVDALDRRRHYYYSTRVSQVGGTASQQTFEGVAQNWELPLLAKYRSGIPIWRTDVHPIFEAGPSFRTRHDLSGASRHGFTAGVGMEFRLSKLRIAPVIRYTRWGAGQPVGSPNATTNDAQALAVLSF